MGFEFVGMDGRGVGGRGRSGIGISGGGTGSTGRGNGSPLTDGFAARGCGLNLLGWINKIGIEFVRMDGRNG